MYNDPYDSFKRGIKNDVRDTGLSLLMVGGLILLAVIVVTVIFVVIKDDKMDGSTRMMWGACAVGFCLLMFNGNLRNFILKAWVLLIVAIPVLLILVLVIYFLYQLCKQPL